MLSPPSSGFAATALVCLSLPPHWCWAQRPTCGPSTSTLTQMRTDTCARDALQIRPSATVREAICSQCSCEQSRSRQYLIDTGDDFEFWFTYTGPDGQELPMKGGKLRLQTPFSKVSEFFQSSAQPLGSTPVFTYYPYFLNTEGMIWRVI